MGKSYLFCTAFFFLLFLNNQIKFYIKVDADFEQTSLCSQPKLSSAKCRLNVENFIAACRKLGVPEVNLSCFYLYYFMAPLLCCCCCFFLRIEAEEIYTGFKLRCLTPPCCSVSVELKLRLGFSPTLTPLCVTLHSAVVPLLSHKF